MYRDRDTDRDRDRNLLPELIERASHPRLVP
jgi:hypothetical protein